MTSEKEIQDRDVESGTPEPAKDVSKETSQKPEEDIVQDGERTRTPNEFEVWWDEPADQDPMNPMNWSKWKKWSTILTLSSITFLTSVIPPQLPGAANKQ
jgi:hypothetical protein